MLNIQGLPFSRPVFGFAWKVQPTDVMACPVWRAATVSALSGARRLQKHRFTLTAWSVALFDRTTRGGMAG
jgi:hypothetical protein